ncbi:hypothetical protein MASR2M15_10880 [Anaerolineales bacterium]
MLADCRIGIIGLGRVGYSFLRLFAHYGLNVRAVYNRDPERIQTLRIPQQIRVQQQLDHFLDDVDLVLICVSDGAIEEVAQQLAVADCSDKYVIHLSGATGLDVLGSIKEKGGLVGSLHPPIAFSDPENVIEALKGIYFVLETGSPALEGLMKALVKILGSELVSIPAGQRERYHLALVILSNYTVTLWAVAEKILADLGLEVVVRQTILAGLLHSTYQNLLTKGIPDALTGPLIRGDQHVIAAHLAVMDDALLKQSYIDLARLTYPLLEMKGIDSQIFEDKFGENDSKCV